MSKQSRVDELCNNFLPEFNHENIFYAESGVNHDHSNWGKLMDRLKSSVAQEQRRFILVLEEDKYTTTKEQEAILDWCHPKK